MLKNDVADAVIPVLFAKHPMLDMLIARNGSPSQCSVTTPPVQNGYDTNAADVELKQVNEKPEESPGG